MNGAAGIATPDIEKLMGRKLPRTDSVSELAEFWDTHDLTDFEDELEEVAEPIFVRAAPIDRHPRPRDEGPSANRT